MSAATVEVTAEGYPVLGRRCPTCDRTQEFVCTGKFRINANGRLADVWLLYRCAHCDFTLNATIIERRRVDKIDREVFDGATENSSELAGRFARDLQLLKRNKLELVRGDAWTLDPRPDLIDADGPTELTLSFPTPLVVRMDQVLAAALGVSRTRLMDLIDRGRVDVRSTGNLRTDRLWEGCSVLVKPER